MMCEHEVMRNRLIELGEIDVHTPICWVATGLPLVNLEANIQNFLHDHAEQVRNRHNNFGNN